jgi:acyl-CoA synthetase (AMP-forming)/AMP-acid ligase II
VLDRFLERTAEALPDAGAFVPDTESLGKAWTRAGLRPGDLVLLCLPNGRELLHQFFGVLMAGGVPALLAPSTPLARLQEITEAMGARAIAKLHRISGLSATEETVSIGMLRVAMLPPTTEPAANPGEVVLLTSGTSGFSSGCVFDIESVLLNGRRHAESIGQRADDTVLVNLPLCFSFALSAQALSSLVCGNRLIISGPPFHPDGFDRSIRDFGVTIASLTPVIIRKLLGPGDSIHRSVALPRVVSVGGDFLEPELVQALIAARPGREVYLTYGLPQCGPRFSTRAAHCEPEWRYSSVVLVF